MHDTLAGIISLLISSFQPVGYCKDGFTATGTSIIPIFSVEIA